MSRCSLAVEHVKLGRENDPVCPARVRLGKSHAGHVESASPVRRGKAALSSGCKSHPATAPAGSNRSSYGGDEIAEAFGCVSRIGDSASVQAATRVNAEQTSKRTMRRPTRSGFRGRLTRLG